MPRRYRRQDAALQSAINSFQRLDPRTQMLVGALLVLALVIACVLYFRYEEHRGDYAPGVSTGPGASLMLGNPSNATSNPFDADNYLMVKPYYALSYNNSMGTPNWVSWQVTRSDLGTAPRKPEFDPDNTLPPAFKVVLHHDYSSSGFDRGHMCPHGDRTATLEMSYATFCMTNVIPQAPNVNRKAWDQLEVYCREMVRSGERLYIIDGPLGRGGRGSAGARDSIAGGKVNVPAECWKVVVAVPENGGEDDLAKIDPDTRVIAVDMPTDQQRVGEEWAGFRTSAAQIEQKTGYHFFSSLRPELAHTLEQKVDQASIPPPRPLGHGGD